MKNPFYREADFYVGGKNNPYLKRWFIIPRNKYFNIYLHQFLKNDEDRALHDHPFNSLSITLKGKYIEVLPAPIVPYERPTVVRRIRKVGSIVYRKATHRHRIELFNNYVSFFDKAELEHYGYPPPPAKKPAWTLFITGPRIREWGFWCKKGFVHWKDFVNPNDTGQTGKGCGEYE